MSSRAMTRSRSDDSVTPLEDEDDAAPRRQTRGRNPLPPTTGPLFPPLPPKQPRVKGSPRTPAPNSRNSLTAPTTKIPEQDPDQGSAVDATEEKATEPSEDVKSELSAVEDTRPSGSGQSGASLTPPPPTSEDPAAELPNDPLASAAEISAEVGNDDREETAPDGEDETGSDDWNAYRRRHGVRGFGAGPDDVKEEPADDQEDAGDGATPRQSRRRSRSGIDTQPGDISGDASNPNSRLGRKRRGEEQLLLDDHLLPAELRRLGKLQGPRDRRLSRTAASDAFRRGADEDVEAPEEAVVEDEEEEPEPAADVEDIAADDFSSDDEEEVTRCVCQLEPDDGGMMIQCDGCKVWQHGPCMGIWGDEEAPNEYYCERCRPDLHGPLKKWIRSKGRNIFAFVPPTPEQLKSLHNSHDKIPPSQSKRWTDPRLMSPHPGKPASKAGARKEAVSPSRNTHDRRPSIRGRSTPAPPSKGTEKPSVKLDVPSKDRDRRKPDHRGKSAIGTASPERGLSPGASKLEPKRRSTMNSRDAAFEAAVKASLEDTRQDAAGGENGDADGEDEAAEGPGRIARGQAADDGTGVEREKRNKGKRKRDEDEAGVIDASAHKAKHPNQYTYRPKPGTSAPAAAASPVRRAAASTPVPQANIPQHEHGTRRAGALATGAMAKPFTTTSAVTHLQWNLPEHLSAYAHLLPSAAPVPLEVRSPRTQTHISRNHFSNIKYGPFTEDRDEHGKLLLPDEPPGRETTGGKGTHLEQPARIKYHPRRTTTSEMRKRVQVLLDYVMRVQTEESRRKERAGLIGIKVEPLPKKEKGKKRKSTADAGNADEPKASIDAAEKDTDGDVEMAEATTDGEKAEAGTAANNKKAEEDEEQEEEEDDGPEPISTRSGKSSAELLAELTRDLLAFQETWATGGFATPSLPNSATLAEGFPSMSSRLAQTWTASEGKRSRSGTPARRDSHEPSAVISQPVPSDLAGINGGDAVTTDTAPEAILTDAPQAETAEPAEMAADAPVVDDQAGPNVEPEIAEAADPNATPTSPTAAVVTTATEPISVYRVGMVDKIITSAEEERVAEDIADMQAKEPSDAVVGQPEVVV